MMRIVFALVMISPISWSLYNYLLLLHVCTILLTYQIVICMSALDGYWALNGLGVGGCCGCRYVIVNREMLEVSLREDGM